MSDSHTAEGQVQRAKRLREQIAKLKSGAPAKPSDEKSLREQVDERAQEVSEKDRNSA